MCLNYLLPVDKSGELDFKEFVGVRYFIVALFVYLTRQKKKLLKTRIPMDEAGYKNLFSSMDADNSGTVSFAELATSLSVIGKGSTDDKLAFTFDLYVLALFFVLVWFSYACPGTMRIRVDILIEKSASTCCSRFFLIA
jgi:hypothetical protein